jgi:pyruvate dehydrogenase E2 component (dihydrolipoamide acetyltransferase)
MATTVEMPKLGNTVEDCLVSAWLKHEGDTVAPGEVIAEIETDKTSFEVTAPVGGVILATFFPAGALVPVFTPICAIGEPGETVGPPTTPAEGSSPESSSRRGPAPSVLPPSGEDAPERQAANERVGQGLEGQPARLQATSSSGAEAPRSQGRLSPRARRFAREHELHTDGVQGRGPGGRVLEADLQEVLCSLAPPVPAVQAHPVPAPAPAHPVPAPAPAHPVSAPAPAHPVPVPAPASMPATESRGQVRGPGGNGAPMSLVRQKIAKRLRESLTSTAQYTLHASANAAGLLAVRKQLKASPGTADVNINDLVVFCTVLALLEAPGLNAELVDGVIYQHAEVNMGFACDTDRGLVVPVVHGAHELSLLGLARRMKELAAQAVAGSISVDNLNGGTFTVTNLGSLGIESFTPVLNPPQVAVLGVDAITLKPVRKRDGNIEFIDSIGLSLTLDHQAVDGAPGARFLMVLRDKIENAETLCTTWSS